MEEILREMGRESNGKRQKNHGEHGKHGEEWAVCLILPVVSAISGVDHFHLGDRQVKVYPRLHVGLTKGR